MEHNKICFFFFFFFFFVFLAFAGYTIKAPPEMNEVVFSSSRLKPHNLVVREVLTGHTLVTLYRGHLCRTYSVVWSS